MNQKADETVSAFTISHGPHKVVVVITKLGGSTTYSCPGCQASAATKEGLPSACLAPRRTEMRTYFQASR